MSTHLPPLQVSATSGAPYIGTLPEVDESYYGRGSYTNNGSFYVQSSAADNVSSGEGGRDAGPTGAGVVTSDVQHQVCRIFALEHPQVINLIECICFWLSNCRYTMIRCLLTLPIPNHGLPYRPTRGTSLSTIPPRLRPLGRLRRYVKLTLERSSPALRAITLEVGYTLKTGS